MQLGRSPTIKEVSMIILAIFSGAMEGIVEEKQRNPLLGIDFSSILFHILAGIIGVIWVFGLTYIVLVGFFRDE